MTGRDRSAEHYARVERERIAGETLLDAAVRLMVLDAVHATGSQKQAAAMLGVSRGVIARHVDRDVARRVNVELGRTDLNTTQRGREWTEARARAAQRAQERKLANRAIAMGVLG